MASQAELALLVKVKDQASKALTGIKGKVAALGKVAKTALKAGMFAGAAAVGAAGIAAVKSSLDFKAAFDAIKVGTGASGPELLALQETAKRVFGSIPVDIKPASEAIADFNTITGATGKPLEILSRNALEAGRLLGEDTKGLVEAGAKALNIFTIEGNRMPAMFDKVFTASQATGVPMTKLMGLVQTFGPVLKNAGFNMIETTALMGGLEKAGIDVTRVMPGLNAFTRKLAEEGITDMKGAFFDATKEIKAAKTESEALNIATKLFGAEGAQRMSAGIRTGALDLEGLIAQMEKGEGAIAATAAETNDFNENLKIFKNNIFLALKPLGDLVLKGLNKLSTWLVAHQDDIQAFIAAFESFVRSDVIPTLQRAFARLADIWEVIGPIVAKVVKFFKDNKLALIALGVAVAALVIVLGGPIIAFLAILAVTTLVLAEWDRIKKGVNDIIAKVKSIPVIGVIFETVFALIVNRVRTAMAVIQGVVKTVMALVKGDWAEAWRGIKETAMALFSGLLSEWRIFLDVLKALGGLALQALGALIGLAWDGIKALAALAWQGIKDLLALAWEEIKALAAAAWEAVKQAIGDALTAMKDTALSILDTVVGFFTDLPGRVVTALGAIGTLLLEKGKALVAGMFAGVKEVWRREVAFFTGLPGTISGAIGAMGATLFAKGKALLQGLVNGVKEVWNTFATWVRTRRDNIVSMIGVTIGALYTQGWDFITGFLNGMKNAWNKVTSWLGDKISGLKNQVTSGFGLFSPSKVMAGYGENITKGLVLGLRGEERNLDRAWQAIMGKVSVPAAGGIPAPVTAAGGPGGGGAVAALVAAAGAGAGAPGGRPITIIIEMDGRVIARAVMPHATRELRLRTGLKV